MIIFLSFYYFIILLNLNKDMSKINVTVRYAVLNKSFEVVGQMKNYVKIRYINGLDVIG